MTELQYYFPYFFNLELFNKELKPFALSSYVTYNSKTQLPDKLLITTQNSKNTELTIPFGATLMISKGNLFYWTTDYDTLDITQINLTSFITNPTIKNQKIDLHQFSLGYNKFNTELDLIDFVTYIRKEDLKYNQDYYERYVIVIINGDEINIIPFDWFNKTGGDYGYVWPAVARFDKDKSKLFGQGMRMADFTVDI